MIIKTKDFIRFNTGAKGLLCKMLDCKAKELPEEFETKKIIIKVFKQKGDKVYNKFLSEIMKTLPMFVEYTDKGDHYLVYGHMTSVVLLLNVGVDYELI